MNTKFIFIVLVSLFFMNGCAVFNKPSPEEQMAKHSQQYIEHIKKQELRAQQ